MRLVSYNIRKARGLDGKRSPERILDVLNSLAADVVALQEADHRLGRRPSAVPDALIASETDYQIAPLARNDVSLGWHGNAILVRKDRRIQRVDRYDLPGFEPRGAVAVTIEDATGPIRVVGVHLGLLRGSREQQLQTLRKKLNDGHAPRTVIAGDFNEWSARRAGFPLAPDYALAPCNPSFPAAYPVATLDRIAHGKGLELDASGVAHAPETRRASDHLPIWADLSNRPVPSELTA